MSITPTGDRSGALAAFGVQAGPDAGEEVPIRVPVARIGSGSQNDVVITDDSVSQAHARLDFEEDAWRITDLRSTNGTYVEGVRLAPDVPTPLPYGSSIRLGGVPLDFRAIQAADPAAARAAYEEPSEPKRLAEERSGFRLPVWLLVLVLLLIVLAVIFFGWIWTPAPQPVPLPQPAPTSQPVPPATAVPPYAPLAGGL